LRTECGAWGRNPHVFSGDTMSVTITDEQFQKIEEYLTKVVKGEAYNIMEKQPDNDALVKFMASLRGHPPADDTEAIIRANLRIWSTISP
jgi:hypothetical protein